MNNDSSRFEGANFSSFLANFDVGTAPHQLNLKVLFGFPFHSLSNLLRSTPRLYFTLVDSVIMINFACTILFVSKLFSHEKANFLLFNDLNDLPYFLCRQPFSNQIHW